MTWKFDAPRSGLNLTTVCYNQMNILFDNDLMVLKLGIYFVPKNRLFYDYLNSYCLSSISFFKSSRNMKILVIYIPTRKYSWKLMARGLKYSWFYLDIQRL